MAQLGFIDKYYLVNGNAVAINGNETTDFKISIYEVFKVVSGIPLFFEDHIERLKNSLKCSNIDDFKVDLDQLNKHVIECCNINNKFFGNIELRISKTNEDDNLCLVGFIPHKYPSPIDYLEGVKVGIMEAERLNPNAKVKHSRTRIRANEYLKNNKVHEVLLLNHHGEITEGSRSNVFFIKGSRVFTAPNKWILPGITRKYVLEAITNLKYELYTEQITLAEISLYDSAFLCGTSIGILPIKSVDKYVLDTNNEVLKNLMQEFNKLVNNHLSDKCI